MHVDIIFQIQIWLVRFNSKMSVNSGRGCIFFDKEYSDWIAFKQFIINYHQPPPPPPSPQWLYSVTIYCWIIQWKYISIIYRLRSTSVCLAVLKTGWVCGTARPGISNGTARMNEYSIMLNIETMYPSISIGIGKFASMIVQRPPQCNWCGHIYVNKLFDMYINICIFKMHSNSLMAAAKMWNSHIWNSFEAKNQLTQWSWEGAFEKNNNIFA